MLAMAQCLENVYRLINPTTEEQSITVCTLGSGLSRGNVLLIAFDTGGCIVLAILSIEGVFAVLPEALTHHHRAALSNNTWLCKHNPYARIEGIDWSHGQLYAYAVPRCKHQLFSEDSIIIVEFTTIYDLLRDTVTITSTCILSIQFYCN